MFRPRWQGCLLLFVFIFTMALGSFPFAEGAAYKDISKHWARNDIEFVSGQGIIAGYSDNTFRPDNNVTRAEYIAMINRTFRLTATLPNTFSDVKSSDWFAADIGKARAAGYISGYSDGTIRPQKSITRQEAAFMIAKVLGLSGASLDSVSKYKDKKSIGSWSMNAVAAVVNRGYMGGYPDNTFRPTSFIKRAEAAVVMRAVYGSSPGTSTPITPTNPISQGDTTYDQAGTYGPGSGQQSIQGDVDITAAGVTLRNTKVSGDLLIARSVGYGSVTLSNVVVQGTLKVEGGGSNSVVLNNSTIPDVIVSKAGVRVVAQGTSDINRVVLTTGAVLEESGLSGTGFEKVSISSTGGIAVNLSGTFDSVTVSASADISLTSGSLISTLTLNSSASVTGKGAITNAYVNASGVYIAQTPGNTVVASSLSASVGGETVTGTTGSNPPVFKSGYPKASNIKDTYFDLLVKTDEAGYAYYVVLANGDKVPSSKQVKSGQNGSGSSLSSSRYGSRSLSANTEGSIRISSLTEGTAYDIYVVAEDNNGNLQSSPTRVDVTASENNSSAPEFYSGYPKKYEVTSTTLEFLTKIDEDGKVYYVVLPSSSSTPTPAQVKAGANASGSTVSSNLRDTIYLNKDTQEAEVVSGLTVNTSYTLYAVAEDDYHNLQTTVKSFDFTTLSSNSCILAFSSYTASIAENDTSGYVTLYVNRTGSSSGTARVFYSTSNGTAYAGSDYTSTAGYLDWASSGDTATKSFRVYITNDSNYEGSETFTVTLDTPSGASLGNPSTITVTITDDETGYALTVQANPTAGGTTTGSGTYAAGASVAVTATAKNGYTFTNWTVGGNIVSASAGFNYPMPSQATTLLANFSPVTQYALTVQANPTAGGTVTGSGTYVAGSSVAVNATANSGYAFVNWTVGGNSESTSSSYSYTMPNAAATIVANFVPVYTLTVQVDPAGGGTVSSAGGSYPANTVLTITATPVTGYAFSQWSDGSTNASLNYTTTAGNVTITASFIRVYTVTLLTSDASAGGVTGAGTYNQGQTVTVTASANSGYVFDYWILPGGATITSNPYIFPASDCALTAHFSAAP